VRVGLCIALAAVLFAGCDSPVKPSPEIVISNLKSNVLGNSLAVCGRGAGLTVTQFTFDFTVQGDIDLSADTSVRRVPSSGSSGDGEDLGRVADCAIGPCATTRRACITAGRSTGSGTIEVSATEEYRPESSWIIEVRQNGQSGVRSNSLTTTVSYPPQ
jgi:hypothetical protein